MLSLTPLSGGLRATCRQARAGDGLPQTLVVPARFTGDLVRLVDEVLRPLERADRLLSGNLDETLWAACAAGGVRDARFLLEHGADPNSIVPSPPKSLMFLVAERGYADLIHVLVDAGASLRDVSRRWRPWRRASRSLSPYRIFMPIDAAIEGGHTRATLALLDRGYHDDEYASHAWGRVDAAAALVAAVDHGSLDTAQALVARGERLRYIHLDVAVHAGHLDKVEYVLARYTPDAVTAADQTAAARAAGREDIARLLHPFL
jgi:hypothetical protein